MEQLDLSYFIKTKSQATDFSVRLATISERIYATDFNLEAVLIEQLGIQKKDHFMVLLRDNNILTTKPAELKSFITKVLGEIAALPVLSITLAFEPTLQSLQLLSDWFLLQMKKQYLFDVSVEPNIIAGAIINVNGKHANFSVKPAIDSLLVELSNSQLKTEKTTIIVN